MKICASEKREMKLDTTKKSSYDIMAFHYYAVFNPFI